MAASSIPCWTVQPRSLLSAVTQSGIAIRPFDPAQQVTQTTNEAIACRWMARQVRKRLGLDRLLWPYWVWATPIDEVLGFRPDLIELQLDNVRHAGQLDTVVHDVISVK